MNHRLRIKEICSSLGLTMEELAEVCGIPRPTLSAYNTGGRNPTLHTMKRISESVGIRVADLIDESRDEIDEKINWFTKLSLKERLRYGLEHRRVLERLRSLKIVK